MAFSSSLPFPTSDSGFCQFFGVCVCVCLSVCVCVSVSAWVPKKDCNLPFRAKQTPHGTRVWRIMPQIFLAKSSLGWILWERSPPFLAWGGRGHPLGKEVDHWRWRLGEYWKVASALAHWGPDTISPILQDRQVRFLGWMGDPDLISPILRAVT